MLCGFGGLIRVRTHLLRRLRVGILILLIILLLVFGGGGFYVGRPGYSGAGAGLGNILYVLAVIALIVIVLRLLGVWV